MHRRQRDGRYGPLKHFGEKIPLLHLFYEARVGIIADNPVKLRLVVTDQAGTIDGDVVYEPLARLASQPEI